MSSGRWRMEAGIAPFVLAFLLAATAAACGTRTNNAADLGKELFENKQLSTSPFNVFSCATCHQVGGGAGGFTRTAARIDPGYDLTNSVFRQGWWGGYETRLLDAINTCLRDFMGAEPLHQDSGEARQFYEYLFANSSGGADAGSSAAAAWPLTVVKTATGLPGLIGDAARGKTLYDRACHRCHGSPHTGAGKIGTATTIPEDTVKVFPTNARVVVEEKIRHGKFFNIGGLMPLYSLEVLSHADTADILVFLGLM